MNSLILTISYIKLWLSFSSLVKRLKRLSVLAAGQACLNKVLKMLTSTKSQAKSLPKANPIICGWTLKPFIYLLASYTFNTLALAFYHVSIFVFLNFVHYVHLVHFLHLIHFENLLVHFVHFSIWCIFVHYEHLLPFLHFLYFVHFVHFVQFVHFILVFQYFSILVVAQQLKPDNFETSDEDELKDEKRFLELP